MKVLTDYLKDIQHTKKNIYVRMFIVTYYMSENVEKH